MQISFGVVLVFILLWFDTQGDDDEGYFYNLILKHHLA